MWTVRLLVILSLVTPGCVAHYEMSTPVNAEASEYQGWGVRATTERAGVTVGVLPHNRRQLLFLAPLPIPVPNSPNSPFGVSVTLETKQRGLSFDPTEVELRLSDGRVITPSKVEAYCSGAETGKPRLALCALSPDTATAVAESVELSEYCCFGLWFDVTPPTPGTHFAVDLGCLEGAGAAETVALGTVRFEETTAGWELGPELGL